MARYLISARLHFPPQPLTPVAPQRPVGTTGATPLPERPPITSPKISPRLLHYAHGPQAPDRCLGGLGLLAVALVPNWCGAFSNRKYYLATTMNDIASHMGSSESDTLDYWTWLGRIVGWDGILPVSIFLASVCIAWVFPQNQSIQTLALLVIPMSAFFCRAYMGSRQINSNCCSQGFRNWQYVAFGFALLLFLAFDFMLVLIEFIPKGRRRPPPEDVPIWVGMIAAYFALVTFAMYPGRRPSVPYSRPWLP